MAAPHGHLLYYSADPAASPLHRAEPHHKLLGLLGFTLLVVATPGEQRWLFLGHAALLLAVLGVSRVPVRFVATRMLVETPVVVFALLLPLVATGPSTEVLGVSVSEPGLTAAVTLLLKATLGVVAALLLAATTQPHDLVRGLERLRLPAPLVQIMAFMVRYLEVVGADLARMRVALVSRGFRARDPRHWPALASALGALFIRSYERGERVHLAMISRGHGVAARPTPRS